MDQYLFRVCSVILGWYLFQLIVLLKPDSNCFNSFTLSWVNKLTIRTWSFVSVIVNIGSWFAAVPATKKQFFDQLNIRLISKLIDGISSVLQKFFDILIEPLFQRLLSIVSSLYCYCWLVV